MVTSTKLFGVGRFHYLETKAIKEHGILIVYFHGRIYMEMEVQVKLRFQLPVRDWKQWRSNVSASRSSMPEQPTVGDSC